MKQLLLAMVLVISGCASGVDSSIQYGCTTDEDQDGHIEQTCHAWGANDCNDHDPDVFLNAPEYCDCVDNDCNNITDDRCNYSIKVLHPGMDDVRGVGGVFGCYADRPFRPMYEPMISEEGTTVPLMNTVFMQKSMENTPEATVWYYGRDRKKYLFSHIAAFESWYGKGATSCCHVRTISDPAFHAIQRGLMAGGKVCFKPGRRILQVNYMGKSWKDLYVVSHKCTIRRLASGDVARQLFGDDWENLIEPVPFAHYFNYFAGPVIKSSADYNLDEELDYAKTIDDNQEL